nr:hypothetical protein [Tanacetum cinerariifolium]
MSTPTFAYVHNMVVFLAKSTESEGFEQITDFMNVNPIKYALTMNPIVYTSCIEQFWTTVIVKNINEEAQLHAKVDGKKVVISKASIKRDLRFIDKEGIDCLLNETIFEQLTLISAKKIAWNEFNSTSASVVICLATNQRFNFSKYIFDSMVKHLDSGKFFFMYPRVESSDKESLGEEDASKHGRKITDIDADKGLTLIDETIKDQGLINNEEMFDTDVLNDEEIFAESVDVVEQAKETVADKDLIDDISLAKALMEIKVTVVGTRPKAKSIIEDENLAWDNVQAMIDADYELTARLQEKEQGGLTIEEKSRLFVELMDKRKKHFAKLRAE